MNRVYTHQSWLHRSPGDWPQRSLSPIALVHELVPIHNRAHGCPRSFDHTDLPWMAGKSVEGEVGYFHKNCYSNWKVEVGYSRMDC